MYKLIFCLCVGWGLLEFAGKRSTILQQAEVSVTNIQQCHAIYPDVTYGQICTYAPGKDSCQVIIIYVIYFLIILLNYYLAYRFLFPFWVYKLSTLLFANVTITSTDLRFFELEH